MKAPVNKFTAYAPAKVNLNLHVVRKREDGYHELITQMQKLALYDQITVELNPGEGVQLLCSTDEVPCDKSNLIWRAAEKFKEIYPEAKNYLIKLSLDKQIPVSAGLGGGSSDAGTLLRMLNHMFGGIFGNRELCEAALTLGADVPFFATDYSAVLATGVGEIMTPVEPFAEATFLLVNPGISVSTRWVFENYLLTEEKEKCKFSPLLSNDPEAGLEKLLHNDLEAVTEKAFPVIAEIKKSLLDAGARYALMSGSGPTVFGIFLDNRKNSCIEIDDALKRMRFRFKNKVYITRTSTGAWPSG